MIATATNKKQKINITDIISDVIEQITIKSDIFSHIDINRILVCLGSNRGRSREGIYGKLVPLKFKNGSDILKFDGRYYTMPGIMKSGIPLLYALYFYSPKFFDLPGFEKIKVIFHELYHISPNFNGDIRRLGKIRMAHGSSKKRFDLRFESEVKLFYKYISNTEYMAFLEMDSMSLEKNYKIYARRMKIPKPIVIKDQNI